MWEFKYSDSGFTVKSILSHSYSEKNGFLEADKGYPLKKYVPKKTTTIVPQGSGQLGCTLALLLGEPST